MPTAIPIPKTSHTDYPRAGEWGHLFDHRLDPPAWTVELRCPECDKPMVLRRHTVAADGTVSPSVVCLNGGGCTWHVFVRLEDWSPKEST